MKRLYLMFLLTWFSFSVYAQSDTIYFSNGKIEGCTVSKITDKTVEYSYPGESLINEVKKSTISASPATAQITSRFRLRMC